MKTLKFYQETDGRWYIDLPDWAGPKEDLEMINGADELLSYLSLGRPTVTLYVSENNFDGATMMVQDSASLVGMYYRINDVIDSAVPAVVWLCPVTIHVFGYYPLELFFKVAETE